MTDRELLEAAAKAVGLRVFDWLPGRAGFAHGDSITNRWNPLEDDGDALRLAATMHLSIMLGSPGDRNPVVQVSAEDGGDECTAFALEPLGTDKAAAMRRAIVRASSAMPAAPAVGAA